MISHECNKISCWEGNSDRKRGNQRMAHLYIIIIIIIIIIILLLLKKIGNVKPGEGDDTLSVRRPQPHTTNL